MADLVDGGVATGTNSFVPGQEAPAVLEYGDPEDDLDFPLDPVLRGEGGTFRPPSPERQIDWPASDDDEPEIIEVMNSYPLLPLVLID